MEINYKFLETGAKQDELLVSILVTVILLLILSLRFFYHKRYILNIYKPNVYMFEYEAKQKNYFSFYAIIGSIVNYLIIFFLLFGIVLHIKQGKISLENLIILVKLSLILMIYKILSDFIFSLSIKKTILFPNLRFLRTSFENHLYFFLFLMGFLMFFYSFDNKILFILNILILFFFLIYSFANFYIILTKHLRLKSSKIILYLCISEILPVIFIIYGLSFQII